MLFPLHLHGSTPCKQQSHIFTCLPPPSPVHCLIVYCCLLPLLSSLSIICCRVGSTSAFSGWLYRLIVKAWWCLRSLSSLSAVPCCCHCCCVPALSLLLLLLCPPHRSSPSSPLEEWRAGTCGGGGGIIDKCLGIVVVPSLWCGWAVMALAVGGASLSSWISPWAFLCQKYPPPGHMSANSGNVTALASTCVMPWYCQNWWFLGWMNHNCCQRGPGGAMC